MRELQQQLKAAKQQAAAEETARLEAALKQAGHAPRTCHTRQMPCTRHAHSRRDRCEESGYASLAITPVHNAGEARQPGGILRDAPRVVHRGQRQGRRRILRVQALARVDGQDGVVGRSSVEKARGQSRSCARRQRSLCVSFCCFARCTRSPGQLVVVCRGSWQSPVAIPLSWRWTIFYDLSPVARSAGCRGSAGRVHVCTKTQKVGSKQHRQCTV